VARNPRIRRARVAAIVITIFPTHRREPDRAVTPRRGAAVAGAVEEMDIEQTSGIAAA